MQGSRPERASEKIGDRLRELLAAGAGTLVLATTVVVTTPADASPPPARSVVERLETLRAELAAERLLGEAGPGDLPRLAWHTWHDWRDYKDHDQVWNNVGSWHNVGYRDDRWQNWQNWHDWKNNVGDWGNRY